ncbi:hypothetical protein HNR65_002154 [Desulfosalsimonas propionicica]|uniref:Uncharacterized protein n=1 Tax=Desulfosalsimonas propionicica TaxID=332175 RepID=A0A7W0HL28_9BACT|nr:hypothetical protein [Desulfosalsimonas propionicica]MBA2881823.1 hypothetical protein [Desulfosalsimonas propionicica]
MVSTADCIPNPSRLESLSKRSNNIYNGLLRGSQFFLMMKVLFLCIGQYLHLKLTIFQIRRMLDKCAPGCENITGCLSAIKDSTVKLRDMHLEFFTSLPKQVSRYNRIYRASVFLLENSLFLLDELVEDCEIGSDQDFRELVKGIAEKF